MSKVFDVAIVGTGFSGLGMGIKLRENGINDFVILERAGDVGGTWRDNHYPGAACDVPSRLYSFSFEPNYRWSRMFSPQKEIYDYMRHCSEKYGITPHIRLNQTVTRADFNQDVGVWTLSLHSGEKVKARFYINGSGGLSRPSYPDIPGLRDFKGSLMHSAEWDHAVTLKGKRIGVIGTGASAIQIVPALAPESAKLTLFQRTPAWVVPKFDRKFAGDEISLLERYPILERWERLKLYCRLEGIGLFLRFPKAAEQVRKLFLKILDTKVKDPELRKKLTPSYLPGCKRILFSDDYYDAVQLPQVEVEVRGIDRVVKEGVVLKDGSLVPLDVLVCATGFKASEDCAPYPVLGRNNLDLSLVWANRAEAYLGTTVHGFPNFFLIIGPNTGLGHTSIVLMIESQIRYIVSAIKNAMKHDTKTLEVKAEAQADYNKVLRQQLAGMVWAKGGCVSWYNTKEGENTTLWPRSTLSFRAKLWKFDPENYIIRK